EPMSFITPCRCGVRPSSPSEILTTARTKKFCAVTRDFGMRRPSRARRICQLWNWGGSLALLVCALPLLAGTASAQSGAGAASKIFKPQVPILTQMTLLGTPLVGTETVVDLQVQALLTAPLLRIVFQLPDGLRLSSGTDTFVDSIARGETKHFQIRVVLSDASAHKIIGTASLEFPDGSRLARAASLTIQPGQQQTSQTAPPILKQSHTHHNVIE